MGLCNDNWIGEVEAFILERRVTWLELMCSCPFWTTLTTFTLGTPYKQHMILADILQARHKTATRGSLTSAVMHWPDIAEQIAKFHRDHVDLPHDGATMAKVCRVMRLKAMGSLQGMAGIFDEATIRVDIVEKFIQMMISRKHPDYATQQTQTIQERLAQMMKDNDITDRNQPFTPHELWIEPDQDCETDEPEYESGLRAHKRQRQKLNPGQDAWRRRLRHPAFL